MNEASFSGSRHSVCTGVGTMALFAKVGVAMVSVLEAMAGTDNPTNNSDNATMRMRWILALALAGRMNAASNR